VAGEKGREATKEKRRLGKGENGMVEEERGRRASHGKATSAREMRLAQRTAGTEKKKRRGAR